MTSKRFSDHVAIITGGADGLGRAIAQRLGAEGAHVALFDTNASLVEQTRGQLASLGWSASAHTVDVTDEAAVKTGIAAVVRDRGRLDIMVNCAGIVGPNGRKTTDVGLDEFDRTIAINLRGSFLMCKYSLIEMLKRNYGRVLLIASIAGKEGNPGMAAYSASKAGVIGLAKAAGKEFAETGITVNALAPAVIRTAMVEGMVAEQVKYMTERVPMKRCGTLEEVASTVAWIVSPEASFNTGFTFDLSGGRATY